MTLLPGRIRVTLDRAMEEVVLPFNYLEELVADPPVKLSPQAVAEGITFIRAEPGEILSFEISRPGWW